MKVFNHYIHAPVLLLFTAEFTICIAALYFVLSGLGGGLEGGDLASSEAAAMLHASVFAAVVVFCMTAVGLYRMPLADGLGGVCARVVVAFTIAALSLAVLFALFPDLRVGPQLMTLAGAVALGGTVASRLAYAGLVNEPMFKQRVLVYGAGRRAAALADVQHLERRGFSVVGFVPAEGDAQGHVPHRLVLDASTRSLDELVRQRKVERVVIAMDDRRRGFPMAPLLKCRMQGTQVMDLTSFLEIEAGKVDLRVMDPSWLIFADGFRDSWWGQLGKRFVDIAGSVVLLAVFLPVMVATAIAILLEDGRPILYRQVRVGLNGRPFTILKFRSMRRDAETAGQAVWARQDDDRVTAVGRVIRKLRIDELPQLANVLMGHMSLVGPRPERPEFVTDLERKIPFYMERHRVRPGITGWAQLCYPYGSSEQDALEKLQYDLFYVKNRSVLFDMMLLLQTVEVVLWQKGSR